MNILENDEAYDALPWDKAEPFKLGGFDVAKTVTFFDYDGKCISTHRGKECTRRGDSLPRRVVAPNGAEFARVEWCRFSNNQAPIEGQECYRLI